MEVHHHPHIEKKGFKEYFLEFLMIFLAVTLGFFAETLREKISENSQAKELAKNLYKEIYSQLRKHNEDDINQLIFYLHERKSGFVGEIRLLTVQKQYAAALIQLINKEYHLKDE